MFEGGRRRTLLALFAVANLGLWVGVACLVGLCASDDLDLGVETLARHAQATAFTSWEDVIDGGLPRIDGGVRPTAAVARMQPTVSTAPPASSADRLSSVEDRQPSVPLWPAIGATPAAIDGPSKPGGASGAGETNSVPGLSAPGTAGGTGLPAGAAPSEPKPGAEAGPSVAAALTDTATGTVSGARLSAPLLLVDPEFHSLSALDLELERSAPLRPVQIRYGERALNREIAALWLTNPTFPCRDVQVDLQDNQVAISGRVTVFGFQADALLEGTVVARDCAPRLEVDKVSLAGVTTPRFVHAQVVALAHEALAWYPPDYPLCLEQIVLEETRVTCYGYRR